MKEQIQFRWFLLFAAAEFGWMFDINHWFMALFAFIGLVFVIDNS